MSRVPVKAVRDRVIWDLFDNQFHRGVWTKKEAVRWMRMGSKLFKDETAFGKMFEIRRITK